MEWKENIALPICLILLFVGFFSLSTFGYFLLLPPLPVRSFLVLVVFLFSFSSTSMYYIFIFVFLQYFPPSPQPQQPPPSPQPPPAPPPPPPPPPALHRSPHVGVISCFSPQCFLPLVLLHIWPSLSVPRVLDFFFLLLTCMASVRGHLSWVKWAATDSSKRWHKTDYVRIWSGKLFCRLVWRAAERIILSSFSQY